MSESLNPIRLTPRVVPSQSKGGRGKRPPFSLNAEPPTEPDSSETPPTPSSAMRYGDLDVGHKLDDEEGRALDVTG